MSTDFSLGADSLGADINKTEGDSVQAESTEGVSSEKMPELTLKMKNEDLIKLTKKWEKAWKDSDVRNEWLEKSEENEKYWMGKQFETAKADKSRPNVDNIIFESLEVYLPQITRRNPEPMIMLSSKENESDPKLEEYVQKVKDDLADIADKQNLRLKLKRVGRHWALYLIGVVKASWDLDKDIPAISVVRPQRMILDPTATIDEDGYHGSRLGEYRKLPASTIISLTEGEKDSAEALALIKEEVNEDLSTEVKFIEWWTREYMCWTYRDKVLLKKKNPHWNYDKEETKETVDTYGNAVPVSENAIGINHLPVPDMPYMFLTVFNVGDQPIDKVSLIGQNLANQDRINKRNKQIDKNVDRMNTGCVISLERSGLTESEAKRVTKVVRDGGTVAIPSGSPQEAVYFPPVTSMPADVFSNLIDTRERVRDIFGTRATSPAGIESEKTVRGKIISRSLDTDRFGGGVSEYLELLADQIYNWFVQLLYVYDTSYQFVGESTPPKITVSVKEGSLLPKDSMTIANQAIELAMANKMSLIDLYKRLEYPNPEELAANVWLELNAPQLLYSSNQMVQQAMGQMQAQAQQQKAEQEIDGQKQNEQDMANEEQKSQMRMKEKGLLNEVPIEEPSQ